MKHLLCILLVPLLALAIGCTTEDSGQSTSSPQPTVSPEATSPAAASTAPSTSTPRTGVDLKFEAVDFEEDPAKLWDYEDTEEGWRRVGVFLDMEYGGGLPQNTALFTDRLHIEALLNAPSGAPYRLERAPGYFISPGFVYVAPGVKMRLYFEGEVPAKLATVDGSTISVRAEGRQSTSGPKLTYFEGTLQLQKAVPFTHGAAAQSAVAFGTPIPIPGGTLEMASLEFEEMGGVEVMYRLTNESSYDLDLTGVDSGVWATLVDKRGCVFDLTGGECEAPPGYTVDCALGTGATPHSGPPPRGSAEGSGLWDLSDALVIITEDIGSNVWPCAFTTRAQ